MGAWFAFLAALFGLPMMPDQLALYQQCTGRSVAPTAPAREGWLVCGRRAGKSFVLALIARIFGLCPRLYAVPSTRRTSHDFGSCSGSQTGPRDFSLHLALLKQVPMLAQMIENERAESFDLTNGVTIEVGTNSYRSVRGYSFARCFAMSLRFGEARIVLLRISRS